MVVFAVGFYLLLPRLLLVSGQWLPLALSLITGMLLAVSLACAFNRRMAMVLHNIDAVNGG